MTSAYYNEIDPFAAQWLRNLIACGCIASGDVDERDIRDVRPNDLAGYTQCHFFAGIGGWPYALRLSGWPDARPVWTGSCPCQPFSQAGQRRGFADERHLWPAWFHLIEQCHPPILFGEQTASKDGLAWLDLVHSDLEGAGYTVGAVDLPACGVGAPHIRNRLWFVAESASGSNQRSKSQSIQRALPASNASDFVRLADPGHRDRPTWLSRSECQSKESIKSGYSSNSEASRVADAGSQRERRRLYGPGESLSSSQLRPPDQFERSSDFSELGNPSIPGLAGWSGESEDNGAQQQTAQRTGGFWADADYTPCRDGKTRPIEPGTFPLAHGIPARVGRLRAYGNAIVPPLAAEMIKVYMECRPA